MNCEECGKLFSPLASEVKRGKGKLCSRACCARKATRLRRSQNGENNPNWKGGVESKEKGRKYRSKYPEKDAAHKAVRNAVRNGSLKLDRCMICQTWLNVEAHHQNYSKPLDVIWLCKSCHLECHKYKVVLS